MIHKIKLAARLQPSSSSADTGKARTKSSRRLVHGYALVKGKANHPMEDYHVAEFRSINGQELGLFGIFDGHLGHDVPVYLQNHLFDSIINQTDFWRNPRAAMLKAYEVTDQIILQKTRDLGLGGSTAVTAVLINGCRLLVANVGDSRAVLCQGGDAIQLSVDHEPKIEKSSIEDKGGFVTIYPGVPCVNGQLAVARAFGDKNLKLHLRSDPDIVEVVLKESDELLILASDGLWKVVENQDAVNIIRKVKNPETVAKMLTEVALSRNSKDDISCIVVRFQ